MISLNKLSLNLLKDTKKYVLKEKHKEKVELSELNLNDIISVDFPDDQYFKKQTNKNIIVLHHTVSGLGVDGDIAWWRKTVERIGTCIIIDYYGKIYQCFSSKYWAYHIGINNLKLEKSSIGIELDAWGGLVEKNGFWYPAKYDNEKKIYVPNTTLKPVKEVQIYNNPYRGFYGFEKYSYAQLNSLRKLLLFFGKKYSIPLTYNPDMWDVCERAINGNGGIWSHSSYRKDKSDVHPQPELINLLKSL